MRICVLGGTRFVGRAVVEHLAARGHELLLIHRGRSEPTGLPHAEHLHVDRERLTEEAPRIEAFGPEGIVDTYAMTAEHADAALSALPAEVPLAVLSSMDVYRAYAALLAGEQTEPVPLTEQSALRAERYPYRDRPVPGADFDVKRYDKLDVEERYLARGAAVLRLGFVYGERDPQRREEFVLRRVRAGRRRIPFGAGSWLGSRLYVGDVGPAVERALSAPVAGGEVFNLCEHQTPTLKLWADEILRAAGHVAELVHVPDAALPADLAPSAFRQPLLGTPQKARTLLGWTETDPAEALERSVHWHLEHPPEAADTDFAADDRALGHGRQGDPD